MKRIENININDVDTVLARPQLDNRELFGLVEQVFREVKVNGDQALRKYTSLFDGIEPDTLRIPKSVIAAAGSKLDVDLKEAINLAARNIETFHRSQCEEEALVETMPGVSCWRKSVGIDSVGIYIPGGSAPLFSTVLMLAIPARLAGCKRVVLCTPPGKQGVDPAICYAAQVVGITEMYAVGGVQAIAGLTYGTESVPRVNKIFGPGNQYVTAAKQFAQTAGVAIDMPAGPSELMVVADETCNPDFVASDLLSQAEHGADSQVVLLSWDARVLDAVEREVLVQLAQLPRKDVAAKALGNSKAVLVQDEEQAIEVMNAYAPEHLILALRNEDRVAARVTNAGSVFLGNYTPESAGDYASGTNHTLPTNGYAKSYSGVSVDSFVKKITFQKITEKGLKMLGPAVELMAGAEQLQAHRNAVTVRLKTLEA